MHAKSVHFVQIELTEKIARLPLRVCLTDGNLGASNSEYYT